MSNFIDQCLQGDAIITDIDDYVESWHKDTSNTQEVFEYLGMNFFEYQLWVEKPESLKFILSARMKNVSVQSLFTESRNAIAARAQDYNSVLNWLKQTGRIDNEK